MFTTASHSRGPRYERAGALQSLPLAAPGVRLDAPGPPPGSRAARRAGATDIGDVAVVNQDAIVVAPDLPQVALENAIRTASAAVFVAGLQMADCKGMATTVVACLVIDPTHAVIAHVGDSRAYLLRAGELAQLTRDHTTAQDLIDQGKLSPSPGNPPRSAPLLTRVVGEVGRPDVQELELRPGDRVLLCSDGLHGFTP